MCGRKNNNRYISEDEYTNRYIRQAIPYEGFITGVGYSFFRYDTICPATCNVSGGMFWDRYTPTMCVQMIDNSDYMKERSWNVSVEDISKLLMRTNPDGTMTVSLGKNNEITLSKEHGKCEIKIEDTGSEINVHVAVEDAKYENGEKKEAITMSQSCRLKDCPIVFDAVGLYSSDGINVLETGVNVADRVVGALSTYNTYESGYLKYNELWHKTKTRGVSWKFQERWDNPGAKYWRQQQIKPYQAARNTGKILRKAGWATLGLDVVLSGELRVSHGINVVMLSISGTGIGSIVAGVWFVADFGTMGVNWIIGNGAKGLGDIIDEAKGGPIIELYEGLY